MAFADRSWSVDQDVQEISRFSCMLFLSVRGPIHPLAIAWWSCGLPPLGRESASCSIGFSKLNSPAHRYLCLRFTRHLAMAPARLEARMDSLLSFPVGLFRPLQHAGLSRRSPSRRRSGRSYALWARLKVVLLQDKVQKATRTFTSALVVFSQGAAVLANVVVMVLAFIFVLASHRETHCCKLPVVLLSSQRT